MEPAAPKPPPLPPAYKDRTTGLRVFGIFTALFGGFLLMGALMSFLMVALPKDEATTQQMKMANPMAGGIMNLVLAAILIWLGIGSMMAKRWARAILVIASWSALLGGLGGAVMLIFMGGRMMEMIRAFQPPNQPALPPGAENIIAGIVVVSMAFFYILLPLIWALFYSSKNVRATCEARDPRLRWTDRCPLPVLAVVLWTACVAALMLGLTMWHPFLPAFGRFITGPPATLGYLILSVVSIYGAWLLYRLNMAGWWIIMATIVLFTVSSGLTYPHYSVAEIYQLMHYPPEQISMITRLVPPNLLKWSALYALPVLAYVFYIRRFLSVEQSSEN